MACEVTISEILISFVAKVQVSRSEQILIEENREIALFTWQKVRFGYDFRAMDKK